MSIAMIFLPACASSASHSSSGVESTKPHATNPTHVDESVATRADDVAFTSLPFKGLLRQDYGPSAADLASVFAASQRAISACMKDRGYVRPQFPVPDYATVTPFYLSYSLSWVTEHGFLPPPSPNRVQSAEEKQVTAQAKSDPAFDMALTGGDNPTRGCNALGNTAVFGQVDIFEVLYDLDNQDSSLQVKATASHAALTAEARWSTCMDKAGYKFPSVAQAYNVQWSEPRPTGDELAAAVSNWNCLTSSRYRETLSAEYVDAVRKYEALHEGALVGARGQLADEVSHAKAYLSGH